MHFVFHTIRMFGIPIFPFWTPGASLIFRWGFFSLFYFPRHIFFFTPMPKISIPPPLFTEKLEKDGRVCHKFWKFSFLKFSNFRRRGTLNFAYGWCKMHNKTRNSVLNYSSHMYTRVLSPYIFISQKWLRMNFYNYSALPTSPFSVTNVYACMHVCNFLLFRSTLPDTRGNGGTNYTL